MDAEDKAWVAKIENVDSGAPYFVEYRLADLLRIIREQEQELAALRAMRDRLRDDELCNKRTRNMPWSFGMTLGLMLIDYRREVLGEER